jgi:hypothetical protein
MPRKYKGDYSFVIENPHGYTDIIPVWDSTSREWKSFYYSSIIGMTIFTGEKK